MNLTFNICWIEDQASDAEVEAVEDAVRGSGFEPTVTRLENEIEIEEFARRQRHAHDYELILLDLRLGGGLRGDDLAPRMRQSFRSTPILFYSAEAEDNLRRRMADRLVEGAYCTHRDRLSFRVGELVSDLSPALNRLSGMRGLAARVVAECDQKFRQLLTLLSAKNNNEVEILQSLKERFNKSSTSSIERIAPVTNLRELLEENEITSGMLYFQVRDLIRDNNPSKEIRAALHAIRDYPNDVIKRRNILAHALEEYTGDGWQITHRATPRPITVDDFQRYRSDFLAHLRDVDRLVALLVDQ